MSAINFFPLDHSSLNENVVPENNTHFNEALKNIVEKDVSLLNKKLTDISSEITKVLASSGVLSEQMLTYDMEHINDLLSFLETKITDIIIEKGSIKVGIFTSNKKYKRDRILTLENAVNNLHQYQDELLVLKREYDKIVERKDNVDGVTFEKNEEPVLQNPLERTVNFYMKKQENGD